MVLTVGYDAITLMITYDKPAPSESFDRQAVDVLSRLRAALAAAIAAIPGDLRRPADLKRAANLDTKLSWRLFKVAHASDPLMAGPHVPGPANIKAFLKAANRLGVHSDLLGEVESAAAEFEKLIIAHASDRSTFESMISSLASGADADQVNLQQRRAAFRANRHIWGVQAATQLKCVFTDVGDDPSKVNVAVVDGYVSLRQLRHEAPLILTSARVADDDGAPLAVERKPIDPRAASRHGLALLQDFCSEPTPELNEVEAAAGFVCGELVSNGLGNRGAMTCFTGWRARNVAGRYRAPHNMFAITHGAVRIPCEAITICLLTRTGLFDDAKPSVVVYSDHLAELPYPIHMHRLNNLLLPDEGVAYIGRGVNVLSTPEIPGLTEMARFVFERLGWDDAQFDVHRCRIAYPVLPSTVAINVPLPAAPDS